jgi:hypothetical protein
VVAKDDLGELTWRGRKLLMAPSTEGVGRVRTHVGDLLIVPDVGGQGGVANLARYGTVLASGDSFRLLIVIVTVGAGSGVAMDRLLRTEISHAAGAVVAKVSEGFRDSKMADHDEHDAGQDYEQYGSDNVLGVLHVVFLKRLRRKQPAKEPPRPSP